MYKCDAKFLSLKTEVATSKLILYFTRFDLALFVKD
jgi:hypothetical protein